MAFSSLFPQVNPNDLSNDADPQFLAEFYKNLKILSQDLYKKSALQQTAPMLSTALGATLGGGGGGGVKNAPYDDKRASAVKRLRASFTNRTGQGDIAAAAQSAAAAALSMADGPAMTPPRTPNPADSTSSAAFQTHPVDYFTAESLQERLKQYAQQGGIPMDYLDRYTASKGAAGSNTSSSTEL